MNKKYNVLVTSCGGDIGQSIGKILKDLNCLTFGWDISSNNAAKFIFDNFETSLKIDKKKYLTNLEVFVKKNEIDIIIPVSEPELRFYTKNKKKSRGLRPLAPRPWTPPGPRRALDPRLVYGENQDC